MQELADHLGVNRNAVVYHVRILLRGKHILCVRQGRRALHFPPNGHSPALQGMFGLFRVPTVRKLLVELGRDPTISWRGLAKRMGLSAHAVRWHVARLKREGLIHVFNAPAGVGHEVNLHPEVRGFLLEALEAPAPPLIPFENLAPRVHPSGLRDLRD